MQTNNLIFQHNSFDKNLSIYIHWPFCISKCPYCSFNSYKISQDVNFDLWQQAYLQEIEHFSQTIQNKYIASIFFGGGTPSLMSPQIINAIINKISEIAYVGYWTEITLEANPMSIIGNKLLDFYHAGINRISLGVQSLYEEGLAILGRNYSVKDVINTINLVQGIFENFSIDLMYLRPNQTLASWKKELKLTLSLISYHISAYQLTIEPKTEFYKLYQQQDEDLAKEFYLVTNDLLSKSGYNQYEVSNYSIEGYECVHNLNYWRYGNYLGLGPGSHSRISFKDKQNKIKLQAFDMIYNPNQWLQQVLKNNVGINTISILTDNQIVIEILTMGLRLVSGIKVDATMQYFKSSLIEKLNTENMKLFSNLNLLDISKDTIKLTDKGFLLQQYLVLNLLS